MADSQYDTLIIGGGQAGVPLAHALAASGQRVAIVERSQLGGSCVNFGCTPTKAAIQSGSLAHQARRGVDYGLRIPSVEVDFPEVLARAKRILEQSRSELEQGLEQSSNPLLLRGTARCAGREGDLFRVEVDGRVLLSAQLVLNTGTRSSVPPIPGLDQLEYLTAENWLAHAELPEHLVMLGGGYIGLEMSQFYRRMGSRVTLIEAAGSVATHEDDDVAEALEQLLRDEGVAVYTNTSVREIRKADGTLTLNVELAGDAQQIEASHIFVATGRRPNTDQLGLDTIGVRVDDKGMIEVDQRLASKVAGVWAAGDIRGGPMFTHTSWDDYRVLQSQLIGDRKRTTERIVPYAMFTDPQLGRVGLTERDARNAHSELRVGRFPMRQSGKAIAIGETRGFIKVVVDNRDRLLGAAVLAADGAELVQVYSLLMQADAPVTLILDGLQIHPTLAEDLRSTLTKLE